MDRRRFPRPPLWLNLLLLLAAGATFAYAHYQRGIVEDKLAFVFQPSPNSPEELMRLRQQLATTDLTRKQIAKELDARMDFLRTMDSQQFYITVDTTTHKLQFRIGRDVAREADVEIDAMPPKGNFWVSAKDANGGQYVLALSNHAVIGTQRARAWVVAPQEDLAAIWPRVSKGTRVFVL